ELRKAPGRNTLAFPIPFCKSRPKIPANVHRIDRCSRNTAFRDDDDQFEILVRPLALLANAGARNSSSPPWNRIPGRLIPLIVEEKVSIKVTLWLPARERWAPILINNAP